MVAALAGVGAMLMSKTAGAKGASAVAIARANLQGMSNIMNYTVGSQIPVDDATHMLAVVAAGATTPGVIPGVGEMKFIARQPGVAPLTNPSEIVIEVSNITSPDVCRAIGGVGFGSWVAITKGVVASTGAINSTSATSTTDGLIPTKTVLETVCANADATAGGITLSFVTK